MVQMGKSKSSGDPSMESFIEQTVMEAARDMLSGARKSHAWDHTLRVLATASRIGEAEGADVLAVRLAALLHDVGRPLEDESHGAVCHAKIGAKLAGKVLAGLNLDEGRRKNILHSIETHRYRGNGAPETLEAKVLFDADKLDSIGAVGIARAFQFAGEVGARLHNPDTAPELTEAYSADDTGFREYSLKLRFIKDRMLTQTGRSMAKERHAFMDEFFRRFCDEYSALI